MIPIESVTVNKAEIPSSVFRRVSIELRNALATSPAGYDRTEPLTGTRCFKMRAAKLFNGRLPVGAADRHL